MRHEPVTVYYVEDVMNLTFLSKITNHPDVSEESIRKAFMPYAQCDFSFVESFEVVILQDSLIRIRVFVNRMLTTNEVEEISAAITEVMADLPDRFVFEDEILLALQS